MTKFCGFMNMHKSMNLKAFNDDAKIVKEGYAEAARNSMIDASKVIRTKHLGDDLRKITIL